MSFGVIKYINSQIYPQKSFTNYTDLFFHHHLIEIRLKNLSYFNQMTLTLVFVENTGIFLTKCPESWGPVKKSYSFLIKPSRLWISLKNSVYFQRNSRASGFGWKYWAILNKISLPPDLVENSDVIFTKLNRDENGKQV